MNFHQMKSAQLTKANKKEAIIQVLSKFNAGKDSEFREKVHDWLFKYWSQIREKLQEPWFWNGNSGKEVREDDDEKVRESSRKSRSYLFGDQFAVSVHNSG